jgi:hypothetical protein
MKLKTIHTGICAIVLIALLFSAGCSNTSGGDTATPTSGATPAATTMKTTAKVTAAVTAAPASGTATSGAAAAATTNPWANFVEPTTLPGQVVTEESEAVTEALTPEPTLTPFVEVTYTEPPTPIPTMPYVADTCANIGGNVCMANETCSGAFIKTKDEALCCAGICEPK